MNRLTKAKKKLKRLQKERRVARAEKAFKRWVEAMAYFNDSSKRRR